MVVERSLATVMFTDIVSSTERAAELGDRVWRDLLRKHHGVVRRELDRHGGREVATAGDGFLAVFEEPAHAILCACGIRDKVRQLGLEIRAGLHSGQVEREEDNVGGIAVHIGARVSALAGGGEVLVSSTVRDLEAGSGFEFEERGSHHLKGVPGEWRVYAVMSCPAALRSERRRSRAWPPALGRGVLAGAVSFLALFVVAGLYMGIFSPGERAAVSPSVREGRKLDTANVAEANAPTASQKAGDSPAAPPRSGGFAPGPAAGVPSPDRGSGPGAEGVPGPTPSAVGAAASDVASQSLDTITQPTATSEDLRASYEAARSAAEESRDSAVESRAERFAAKNFQRGESLLKTAVAAAKDGRYAEARETAKQADAEYTLAAAEGSARAILDELREAVRLVRRGTDRTSQDYARGQALENRAAAAERARRYREAAAHLRGALAAFKKAVPEPKPLEAPPAPPAAARQAEPSPAEPVPPAPSRQGAEAEETPAATLPEPGPNPRELAERALGEIARALEAEDIQALQRTWVTLTPGDARNFTRWFDLMRDIRVSHDLRSAEGASGRITARVATTYRFFNETSEKEESQTFDQVLELEERNGGWVVVANRQ